MALHYGDQGLGRWRGALDVDPSLLALGLRNCTSFPVPWWSSALSPAPPSPPKFSFASVTTVHATNQGITEGPPPSSTGGCPQRGGTALLPRRPWPGGMILTMTPDGTTGVPEQVQPPAVLFVVSTRAL